MSERNTINLILVVSVFIVIQMIFGLIFSNDTVDVPVVVIVAAAAAAAAAALYIYRVQTYIEFDLCSSVHSAIFCVSFLLLLLLNIFYIYITVIRMLYNQSTQMISTHARKIHSAN